MMTEEIDLTRRAEHLGWVLPHGWVVRSKVVGCNCDMIRDDPITPEAVETWLSLAWEELGVMVGVFDEDGSMWSLVELGHHDCDDADPFREAGYRDAMIHEALNEVAEYLEKAQGVTITRKA